MKTYCSILLYEKPPLIIKLMVYAGMYYHSMFISLVRVRSLSELVRQETNCAKLSFKASYVSGFPINVLRGLPSLTKESMFERKRERTP